jgi:argininosuccinate lyase
VDQNRFCCRLRRVRSRSTEHSPQELGFEIKSMRLRSNESWKIRKENPGFAMSSVAATLAKFLWMFVCIWVKFWFHHFSASNHRFQHHATQEKTRMFELIRGKCNKIQALPYEIL